MEFEKRKIEWLEFDLLEPFPHVIHGVFLRHGGASQAPFATLNLSADVGDHPDTVKLNRESVRKTLDFPKILLAHQVHGANVHRVTAKNLDKIPTADALFTTEKHIGIGVTHADCQAAIFYDPVHEAVAIAHCGWKGSAQNIYSRVVAAMHQEIGTQAHNLIVCISPSLGPDHAEFKNYKQEIPQDFWSFQPKPSYFDFWEISKKQLNSCGIPEKNIEISGLCTVCNTDDYFSYRTDKKTGRNLTIVGFKG
ncbi:MAG TPA: peptidoglycan editing factor PgeF [Chlamydiales bacterium]|nr:peptidoglycan editing factor PgeF [Chlamydiales bacterium]